MNVYSAWQPQYNSSMRRVWINNGQGLAINLYAHGIVTSFSTAGVRKYTVLTHGRFFIFKETALREGRPILSFRHLSYMTRVKRFDAFDEDYNCTNSSPMRHLGLRPRLIASSTREKS